MLQFHAPDEEFSRSVALSYPLCYDSLTHLTVKYLVLLKSHIPKGLTRIGIGTIRSEVTAMEGASLPEMERCSPRSWCYAMTALHRRRPVCNCFSVATAFRLQLSRKLVASLTTNQDAIGRRWSDAGLCKSQEKLLQKGSCPIADKEPHQKLCIGSSVFSIRSIICTKFALAFVKYSVILPCQVRIWKEIPYSWLP